MSLKLKNIYQLIKSDFESVNECIVSALSSNVELIGELGHYIVNSGGKRLRPLLVLISAKACGYQGHTHIPLAAIIEFIHTATLLHDDVVDHSTLRRGRATAHTIWGNEASVLVGDFLYSRAFQMMVNLPQKNLDVMKIMANTTNAIAEGEVLQLVAATQLDFNEQNYLNIIQHKTAKLFEAASMLGAILAEFTPAQQTKLGEYGLHLGYAFQIVDDVLDFKGEADQIGKNIGDDLAEGKITLPLIYAFTQSNEKQKQQIKNIVQQKNVEDIGTLIRAIESTGAIAYTMEQAKNYIDKAINSITWLKQSPFRQALIDLAEFAIERNY